MLITVHSHGEKRRSQLLCEWNKRPRAVAGDIFLCYLHWPIRRPVEGGSALCMCVCKKVFNISGREISCTHTYTHSHSHTDAPHFQGKGEKGDVTGKGLAQLAHSAVAKWFRFFPQRGRDTVWRQGEMKGEGVRGTLCNFKLKRIKHDFSIKSNKVEFVKTWKTAHPHMATNLT